MISQPTYFYIPPEIEAGLLGGDLIQYGGIVRNQMGQIVKHLKEVPLPLSNEKVAAHVAGMLKNPRVLIPTAVVGTLVAGAAVIAVVKKRRQSRKPQLLECVQSYNASLAAYVEAVHEGRLELEIIDRLIADLDAVKAYSNEDGSITLDFSTKQAEMLVNIVVDYTRQLAEANSVDLDELQGVAPASENDAVVDLRRHLEAQRKIFTEAA
ncbi:hypothetical protein [Streptomyces sp. SID13726]|uniref:hypothetical protein n=1 Tax=Streptomyces sp. SID13726 TaxID=2706058 RepID=UPI0013B7522E|nr:hypothetical protein [Streptomyces sp. SID13726]NEB03865.1 hypothetical protein [Streptomyces sp. SID13726]